jgi:RNA polymerase sigma-70 factor (ECF subfamily)
VVVPLTNVERARPEVRELPVFADVFRAHAPFTWRCLRRLGVAASDAEDVCQEVFVVVHKKLGEYDGRSSLRAWIYGIAVRKASDYRRLARVRHEKLVEAPGEERATNAPGPERSLEHRRDLELLDRALGELDDDKRNAFVLHEIEGLTLAEVAAAVSCPLQTLYSRLNAARRHVEAALDRTERRHQA